MRSLVTLLSFVIVFNLSLKVFADGTARESDAMDIKAIEEKYWSSKDTDFNVVQNRHYAKEKRFFFSLSYGPIMNDPYSIGRMTSLNFGHYFSERTGLEFGYETASLKDNDSTEFFKTRYGANPDYNLFKSYKSINYIISPFYAKMSFWNQTIIYFDMQFAIGIGQMTFEQQVLPEQGGNRIVNVMGFNFDITQQFFFHRNWAIRLDIKNKFTNQERLKYKLDGIAPDETQRSLGTFPIQDTSILFGATYFF